MLNPPRVESKSPAQTSKYGITIPFQMNKSVGWVDFTKMVAIIKTVSTNSVIQTLYCDKEAIYIKNNIYQGLFNKDVNGENLIKEIPFKIGQYYKVQLAYLDNENNIGFYSSVTTFKFTAMPTVTIQNLTDGESPNVHIYNYVGCYSNEKDPSEKVYSYKFDLYDIKGSLVVSSDEQLHNSLKDTSTHQSIDEWTTRYGLESGQVYTIVYKVKTVNGLEVTSPSYRIGDNWTVPSSIFKYCSFVADNIIDSACVKLSLIPKEKAARQYLNGQFVLLRSSSEDNFQSWHELTRFILASHDSKEEKFICKDYSISQGERYVYALQAYNNLGVYSEREKSEMIQADFEDVFLSDGKRQLKIKYNPKVSSLKNTILESKLDTLGGKYPFFFRNGNVKYKEFPVSGLISMLMDDNEEFMFGIYPQDEKRSSTPSFDSIEEGTLTSLTGDNFRREREFKLEVLEWLTNGEPKLFRSPGEGSYIVRLMNTSLSPNDTLSRMIHTFSSTAYEIADFTFENLRKYGMLMEEYLETRELKTHSVKLHEIASGKVSDFNACLATIVASPSTEFYYRLQGDLVAKKLIIGPTGVYKFPNSVLADTPLVEVYHAKGMSGWMPEATLTYSTYVSQQINDFSYIHSIEIKDKIAQWIGSNRNEMDSQFDSQRLLKDLGTIYYINIQKRHVVIVDSATKSGSKYIFKISGVTYTPNKTDLIYCDTTSQYYDGRTSTLIGSFSQIDYNFKLRENDSPINFYGTKLEANDFSDLSEFFDCEAISNIGGRLVLTDVKGADCLYIGNGLQVDIAYQEINKIYTEEITLGSAVKIAKDTWLATGLPADYQKYYDLLVRAIKGAV